MWNVKYIYLSSNDAKDCYELSMDEGSFDTRILVAIRLLLVFNKYQQGRG